LSNRKTKEIFYKISRVRAPARYLRRWRPGSRLRSPPVALVSDGVDTNSRHRHRGSIALAAGIAAPPLVSTACLAPEACFSATAECGAFASLGWRQPRNLVDLWAEFRVLTNGTTHATRFLEVLRAFGIPALVDDAEKEAWRTLCKKGSFDAIAQNREGILAYCETDVLPLVELYRRITPNLNWPGALFRGRYGVVCAEIEYRGIPIDAKRLAILSDRWKEVRFAAALIASTKMRFQIFGGPSGMGFSYARFEEYLRRIGLLDVWPRTRCGRPATDDDTLKAWTTRHDDLQHLRQARRTLSMVHPGRLKVGKDGRCRTSVRPFAANTGRNQPKAETPLAFPAWMRALMVGPIAVLDYAQEEFALAAALSGDRVMLDAYESGDAYLAHAIQCGALPRGSKRYEPGVEAVRDIYKTASVAIMYGVSPRGLAGILGVELSRAHLIMARHRRTYPDYWRWSDETATTADFVGEMETVRGWRVNCSRMSDLSIRNWPIQSTGGDILRLAAVKLSSAGIPVVALIHDAAVIEIPECDPRTVVDQARAEMIAAGQEVAGVTLRVDGSEDDKLIRAGQRYFKDDKARTWWKNIWKRLGYGP
jgi:DNA polymerase I